ncbi:MAG: phosphotransferase [Actinobacteria bacterium]|nr:MAG: phosphotransferase [Actinomycetota bacterium]
MNTPPADLDETELVRLLAGGWGLDVGVLRYLPRGFGSHHWLADMDGGTRYFLTVDDLDTKPWLGPDRDSTLSGLTAALEAVLALHHQGGLAFVVPPVPTRDGKTLRRITSRYTLSVFPYIDGGGGAWGEHLSEADRDELVRLLADLHLATRVLASPVRSCGDGLAGRAQLDAALRDLDRPWTGGPFSEPARRSLAAGAEAVLAGLAARDDLAAEVAGSGAEPVITHGEPHPGNLIRAQGRFRLVDWDTVGLAPPERDLWMLHQGTTQSLTPYSEATGRVVDETAIALYRLSWTLGDLALYVALFRSHHERTEDTEKARRGVTNCIRRLERRATEGQDVLVPWESPAP